MFGSNCMTRTTTKRGCTIKPTPRSETARLKGSVVIFFGNDEVFVIAYMVKLLNRMAVTDKKALKTHNGHKAMFDG